MEHLLQTRLLRRLQVVAPEKREALVTAVATRQTDPYTAVAELFTQLSS